MTFEKNPLKDWCNIPDYIILLMWGMCIIFPGINQGIVVMDEKAQNSISTKELCREYDWYENTFPSLVQDSCSQKILILNLSV